MRSVIVFVFIVCNMIMQAQTTKVLFIGNSYTYVNDLPQTFHDLALSKGDTVVFDMSATGGYRFIDHLSDAATLSKIGQQAWNYVVLQEQSQMPSFSPAQVASDVYPYARRLDSLVRVNNACSETMFYMTWGRKNGDASNCAGYPPVCTFSGMNARLRESYLQMAQDDHASVSPVGVAWKRFRDAYPAIDLYQADESHPSIYGTYLAACVFYAGIFHKTPVGASAPAGISSTEAMQLQSIAGSTVLDSLGSWQQYGDIPNAAFSFSVNGPQVQFTNHSANASSYQWQFGDLGSSTQTDPLHTYTSSVASAYLVSLTASDGCKSFTAKDSVVTEGVATGIRSSEADYEIGIFPNPAHDQLTVIVPREGDLQIVTATGDLIYSQPAGSSKVQIDLDRWPAGVYCIRYTSGAGTVVKKFVNE